MNISVVLVFGILIVLIGTVSANPIDLFFNSILSFFGFKSDEDITTTTIMKEELIIPSESKSINDSLYDWDNIDKVDKEKIVDEFFFKLLDVETRISSGRFTFITNTPYTIPKKYLGADFIGNTIKKYEIHIYRSSSYINYDICRNLIKEQCIRINNETNNSEIYNCSYYESYKCNPHIAWRIEEVEEMQKGDIVEYFVTWDILPIEKDGTIIGVKEHSVDCMPYVNITDNILIGINESIKIRADKWLWFNTTYYGFSREIENVTENIAYVVELCGMSFHFRVGGGTNFLVSTATGCDGDIAFVNTTNEIPWGNATNSMGYDIAGIYNASGVWSLDMNTGQDIYDLSGYDNNGTCFDGVSTTTCNWTTGIFGTGIEIADLAGTTNWIELGKPPSLDISGTAFTIEAWVKRENAARGTVIGSSDGNADGYWLGSEATGVLYFNMEGIDNLELTNFTYTLNEWNHVVATFDGAKARIYLNGTLWGEVASTGSLTAASGTYRLGEQGAYPNGKYWGIIDEVRIYNRTLSDAEILQHYHNSINASIPGLKLEAEVPVGPSVTQPMIIPDNLYETQNCTGIVTLEQSAITVLVLNYTLLVNSVSKVSEIKYVLSGNETSTAVFGSGNYSAGDTVNITVHAYDGTTWGLENSTQITVLAVPSEGVVKKERFIIRTGGDV